MKPRFHIPGYERTPADCWVGAYGYRFLASNGSRGDQIFGHSVSLGEKDMMMRWATDTQTLLYGGRSPELHLSPNSSIEGEYEIEIDGTLEPGILRGNPDPDHSSQDWKFIDVGVSV